MSGRKSTRNKSDEHKQPDQWSRQGALSLPVIFMTAIRFDGIDKRYGKVLAADAISLEIESGQFYSLVGPSGCGKTTLLRIAAGLILPDAGEIYFDRKPVKNLSPSRRNIGFVFQDYALFPTKTVEQNIGFSLSLQHKPKPDIQKRVAELAAMMDLSACLHRYPHELSGGQQQRVSLARALASEPSVLLLDEPLSALDAKIRAHLRTEIRQVCDTLGVTTLYVTHDQEEAMAISDHLAVMDHGRVLQVGSPAEVYLRPANLFIAQFIGASNVLPCTVTAKNIVRLGATPLEAQTNDITGGEAVLVLRPEHLTIKPARPDALNGVLGNISFLGSIVRLTFDLLDSLHVYVDLPTLTWTEQQLEPGSRCALEIRPDLAQVFPAPATL